MVCFNDYFGSLDVVGKHLRMPLIRVIDLLLVSFFHSVSASLLHPDHRKMHQQLIF